MKEISNIIMDFVKVISELNYLCLFSISFPISFLIAFGVGIIQIQVDKKRFLDFYKRPLP
jgi:hypothetical protein